MAASYTKEALLILTGNKESAARFREVEVLARAGGIDEAVVAEINALRNGTSAAAPIFAHIRNKIGFHWDPSEISDWIRTYSSERVTWAEGFGEAQGESLHTAAANALLHALMKRIGEKAGPAVISMTDAERFSWALRTLVAAMRTLLTYYETVIGAFLKQHHAKRHDQS